MKAECDHHAQAEATARDLIMAVLGESVCS